MKNQDWLEHQVSFHRKKSRTAMHQTIQEYTDLSESPDY